MSNAQRLTKIEYEQQVANCERLNQEILSKNGDLKLKEEELTKLKIDVGRMQKSKEGLEKKIGQLESWKAHLEGDKGKLMATISTLEKEMHTVTKQQLADRKMMDSLNREKEMIAKAAQKAAGKSTENQKRICGSFLWG